MKVFIDTGAFISLFIKQDIHHQEATQKYQQYKSQKVTFVTSDYILDELFTWFAYHQPESIARRIVESVSSLEKSQEIKVLEVDLSLRQKAGQIFTKYLDHPLSFTDATTVAFYKELKIDELFTFDSDFSHLKLQTSLD